ncbi:hypothetical protein [Endozoicomonas elysicola]|nr:hypothetical protein [Endozoicomonas elysicola]
MGVPSSRIVTMVHPSIVHNNIPAPALQNSFLYGQPHTLQPDQNACVLNTQFMETLYCNRQGGVDGVFHGQQVTVQRQPVIFMGLPEVGCCHGDAVYQSTGNVGCGNGIAGGAGLSIQPLSSGAPGAVQFYDINRGVIPVINNISSMHTGLYGACQEQVSESGFDLNAAVREPFSAEPEQGNVSAFSQESQFAAAESGESSRRITDDASAQIGRGRRRRRNGCSQNLSASLGMGSEVEKGKDVKPKKKLSSVAVGAAVKHGSAKHDSAAKAEPTVELRVKEEFSVPLSAIPDMRKKLRLLIESMNKDDPSLFVDRLQNVVKSIDENKSQHVWVSLSEFELQLLVDARARLYSFSRGCPRDKQKVELISAERILVKFDPVIARAFEGYLDEIDDSVCELLFRTLDVLMSDSMMGVSFLHIDLGMLVPYVSRIPLDMSAGLAKKIACYFEVSRKNKNDLIVNIYQDFKKRLGLNGCITLQKELVQHCFSQFFSAFFNLPLNLFHRNVHSEPLMPIDREVWMQDLEVSQNYFLSEYWYIRGEQLGVRRSRLEDDIINGEELLHAEKLMGMENDEDTKEAEKGVEYAEVKTILSNEDKCDRACELFRNGDVTKARALYEEVLEACDNPLISFSCKLALMEVDFKELGFDQDYLSCKQIIRKSYRIFNDFRNACVSRGYRLETKACELEQMSDEADEMTKQFDKKWTIPIEQQSFSIDELKTSLQSLTETVPDEDLGKLKWYINEVEKLHKAMGGVLPLLKLSTCRLDQAFDDRDSWLSEIPGTERGAVDGEHEGTQSLSLSASKHQERLRSNGKTLEWLEGKHKRLHNELAALKKAEFFSSDSRASV